MALLLESQFVEARSPLPHVFVVGAGFSKAISESMPTLGQLGTQIAAHLKEHPSFGLLPETARSALEAGSIPLGDLETWLSTLASPGPFVSEEETHYYAGIFAAIANIIGQEINASEADALKTPAPPPWLEKLVRIWNGVGATIVSFNYDTLIEHAATLIYPTGHRWPNVAFKLLKVHGSTNWWRARGDSGSEPEYQAPLPGWGVVGVQPAPIREERMLVPPIAAKGSYYDPAFIRRQWQQARIALEHTSHLFVAGYSLPANDLAATSLISQHLATNAAITLVNLSPKEPGDILVKIGRPANQTIGGSDSISAQMLATYEQLVGRALAPVFDAKLAAFTDDPPLLASVTTSHAIAKIAPEADRIVVLANDTPFKWEDEPTAVRVSELRTMLAGVAEERRSLVVRTSEGDHLALALRTPGGPVPWLTIEG